MNTILANPKIQINTNLVFIIMLELLSLTHSCMLLRIAENATTSVTAASNLTVTLIPVTILTASVSDSGRCPYTTVGTTSIPSTMDMMRMDPISPTSSPRAHSTGERNRLAVFILLCHFNEQRFLKSNNSIFQLFYRNHSGLNSLIHPHMNWFSRILLFRGYIIGYSHPGQSRQGTEHGYIRGRLCPGSLDTSFSEWNFVHTIAMTMQTIAAWACVHNIFRSCCKM